MKPNQYRSLRILVIIMLILLWMQYELGMSINLSPSLPQLPSFGFSLMRISSALHQAGLMALAHAILGSSLAVLSLLALALSLASNVRRVQIVGALGSLFVVVAAAGGVLFTL